MSATSTIRREDLEQLIEEHRQLIRLANELEYQLYRLGEAASADHVSECQHAAGSLIGLLRMHLFRQDQEVLPVLESYVSDNNAQPV
jgi:hemerythrin-like domain-containing protein